MGYYVCHPLRYPVRFRVQGSLLRTFGEIRGLGVRVSYEVRVLELFGL